MKLWKRVSGALKDKTSILFAGISRRTSNNNPNLETIIIKATSHDELFIDYKNFKRVYQWVHTSPLCLKPLIYALSTRMEKTNCWPVALKGLMLIHGVLCCKIPAVNKIGRLPFDLSNFTHTRDKHSTTIWGYNVFIRAYFSYLDQKSTFVSNTTPKLLVNNEQAVSILDELKILRNWQCLFGLLLQVRPRSSHMKRDELVFEAMSCVVTEVYQVYGIICKGIAQVLLRIYAIPGKEEATLALEILREASFQGEALSGYIEFCRDCGFINSLECPKVEKIPETDITELEDIIRQTTSDNKKIIHDEILIVDSKRGQGLKTIITDKWVVFEEDWKVHMEKDYSHVRKSFVSTNTNMTPTNTAYNHIFPDLICF